MKKHLSSVILALVFLIGLSMLLYPTVSDYINKQHSSRAIANYDAAISKTSEDKISEIFEDAEAYNQRIAATPTALYAPAQIGGYSTTLNPIGSGIMGYLDIPKIGVELPIYHGVDEGVLQIGVGHIEGTSLPTGGENTHCVLSGHRGLPSARLFTDLDAMQEGDFFSLTVLNRVLTYRVDQIKVVLPSETDDMEIVRGEDHCTLVTCTPYGVNTHRLLVRGIRVVNEEEAPEIYVTNEALRINRIFISSIAAVPLLLMLLIFAFSKAIQKYTKRNQSDGKEERQHETE